MRLICGLLRLDGADADPDMVRAMATAMIAPNLSPTLSVRTGGEMGLALLDFAPTGAGAIVVDDQTWLAADLRLDRRIQIAEALRTAPAAPIEDLALAAARRWDVALPDRLDGDFALALWDARRQRLLLARDALGVRPLCHATIPGKAFLFASLPSGVIGSGLVALRPDLVALAERLTHAPVETTGLAHVDWLPAACAMVVTPSGPGAAHRAWRPETRSVGCFKGDAREAARRLRALMQDAVAERMADAAPVGVQLSGGLDSSAIAVLAARIARRRGALLPAYAFLADPAAGLSLDDETPFIEAVLAQEPNLTLSAFRLGALATPPPLDVDRLTAGFVEPVLNAAYAAARADGRQRLLSGMGGDETASQQHERLHLHMLASGQAGAMTRDLLDRARRVGVSPARMAYRLLVAPWLRSVLMSAKTRPIAPALAFLAASVTARCRVYRRRGVDARPADRLERVVSGLMANRVNDLALAGARHGLAFSFPMLDRKLVEFCLSLPPRLLTQDGYMRQPFRAAMDGVLPEAVRWRESKFLVLPDIVPRLQAARPQMLALAERLRQAPAARAFLNFSAIDQALAEQACDPHPRDRRIVDLARVLSVAAQVTALEDAGH